MGILSIPGTSTTPTINSDSSQGFVEIKGRSNPENSIEFFKPLINWTLEYVKNPREITTINLEMEHFNSSSSKCLLNFLRLLEPLKRTNKQIQINWHYEKDDDEMLEAGETYEALTGLKFTMRPFEKYSADD